MSHLETIAFDADDTLWQNERFYRLTQDRFAELLVDHADPALLASRLLAAEKRNLGRYGFGIKGFMLSMIETAVEVTDRRVTGDEIAEILAIGQDMLRHPVELLPHARETIETLAHDHRILLVTKGDLLDQERKLAQSGLGELFDGVEIVSDKRPETYSAILGRHGADPARSAMVGNSMKSDVLPMIAAGGWGIFVPHDMTWEVESAEAPQGHPRFRELRDLGALPGLIAALPG